MSKQWATMTIITDGFGYDSRAGQDEQIAEFSIDHLYTIESLGLPHKIVSRPNLKGAYDVAAYDFSATMQTWNRAGFELGY